MNNKIFTTILMIMGFAGFAQDPVTKMEADVNNSASVYVFLEWPANASATNVQLNVSSIIVLYSEPAGGVTKTDLSGATFTTSTALTRAQISVGVSNPDSLALQEYILTNTPQFGSATVAGTRDTLFKLTFANLNTGRVARMLQTSGASGAGKNNGIGTLDNAITQASIIPQLEYRPNGTVSSSPYTAINLAQSSSTLPLPVELLYLTADWQGEDAVVEWETASELNNSHFDVERSFDGSGFEYIGTVGSQATGGNSNQRLVYTYTDLGAKARTMKNVFYRLIQTDFDGASEVFGPALLRVNRTTETSIALFPVPAQNQVTVQTIGLDEGVNYTLRVIGNLGNTVQESTFLSGRSYNKTILDISSLPSGVYRVTVEGGNLQGEVEKFIKID